MFEKYTVQHEYSTTRLMRVVLVNNLQICVVLSVWQTGFSAFSFAPKLNPKSKEYGEEANKISDSVT